MKKFFALLTLSALVICMLCACATKNAPSNDGAGETQQDSEMHKIDISDPKTSRLLSFFVGHFHAPYDRGDHIDDVKLISFLLYYCAENIDTFDFISDNSDESVLTISEDDLTRLGRCLFTDDFDASQYRNTLDIPIFSPEDKTFSICYATDFWYSDDYAIDREFPVYYNEQDGIVSLHCHIGYSPDYGIMQDTHEVIYTLEKQTLDGTDCYKLIKIENA